MGPGPTPAVFHRAGPVSYTHLDVYKRQLKDLWAHIAHEDFYLGAACMAGGYCVVQLLVFTITGKDVDKRQEITLPVLP